MQTTHFPATTDQTNYIQDQWTHTVWTREKWSDEWEIVLHLYAVEVTWSVAPTLPVAVLEMDYGNVSPAYASTPDGTFREVAKTVALGHVGHFVKIECLTNTAEAESSTEIYRRWYGIIEEAHDEQGGVEVITAVNPISGIEETKARSYGRITLVAYGLEKLLADHQVLTSRCGGSLYEIGVPLDFNRAGPKGIEGNRHEQALLGVYGFAEKPSLAATWSTRNIVEYLLNTQTPRDETGKPAIQWTLHDEAKPYITDKDTPLVKCDSATTYSLLSQLIDRRRGLMWWAEVAEGETYSFVYIRANSINAAEVKGNKITIPANRQPLNIEYDGDPLTNVVVNTSDLPLCHQVVVYGPRIRCVGTFSADDDNLEAAWTAEEETAYEAGGAPHPAGTARLTKETRNTTARSAPKLANVFSLFRIPEDWNCQVRGGEYLFLDELQDQADQCYMALAIDQTLPIIEGEDYAGTRIRAGLVPREMVNEEEMKPLCFFRRPYRTTEPYKYQPADGVNAGRECTKPDDNERLQCRLSVPPGTMTVRLTVEGQPQHAIAYADFTPIPLEDKACGKFDWRHAIFTLSIESQSRTKAAWPDPPLTSQAVRKKVIYAGDQYYQHYVAPKTVIGVDKDGYLVESDGGWIPTLGSPEDPIPLLEDIATISAAWYATQHFVLSLESYRLKPNDDVPLGALILQAGGGVQDYDGHKSTVNAPVTEIKFRFPRGTGERCPAGSMHVKTWAGELDAVEFVAVKPPQQPQRRPARPMGLNAPGAGAQR